MAKRILDTSVLIRYWNLMNSRIASERTTTIVRNWAQELIARYDTKAIVSPVYIEFVAGTQNADELTLARVYLKEFEVIDGWNISHIDLENAKQKAERIPSNGKRRQFGDCLIAAISQRLNHDVESHEIGFPQ